MPKPIVFVTRNIPKPGLDKLETVFQLRVHASDKAIERSELLAAVRDVDALLCLLTDTIDKELMDAAPRLKCVSNYAVGYNNIDVDYATSKNIAVCNTPGVLTESTADLAWALLMACARRVVEADRYLRDGLFTGWEPLLFLGNDVFGKTLGIIGMGRIGQAVARRAQGFGMKVLWHGPRPQREDLPPEYQWTDLETLCKESDFISIHAPQTSENHHLLGANELAWMKPSAILINTARGAIVEEAALINALQTKEIAAAGLDVFEREPKVPQALMDLPNVVLLPHIGSASIETRNKMALMAAENAIAVILGKNPPARLN
ncbi:MAG: D-glycerate dehydrogenase [Candidatus Cloacimonadaceae bacterium]|jgi:glyoxylate reductase|nr:D-glycerate dehydrogenase [Candidatus Cloacimonadota bacterium]MDX9948884.1 D-glycerate dehydrogenase [Candidatus Syntrophosphaera sp.]NLN85077.1 D-glycerate dehydrogenase [Candidatus Cloacimonadota bacterium]